MAKRKFAEVVVGSTSIENRGENLVAQSVPVVLPYRPHFLPFSVFSRETWLQSLL